VVIYASSVSTDERVKMQRRMAVMGFVAVMIFVGVIVGLTYEVTNLDEDMDLLGEQDVFSQCVCSRNNMTKGLLLVWSSNYLRQNITGKLAHLALSQRNPAIQSHVLCMTYVQLNGQRWQVNDQWLTGANYCEWFGVSCSFLSRITAIELPLNLLNGMFPLLLHHMLYLGKCNDLKMWSFCILSS
jgi:hypothetical protein